MLSSISEMKFLTTVPRIKAVISCARAEINSPFYFDMSLLTGIVKSTCLPRALIVTQLEKLKFEVSVSHTKAGMVKTNAPVEALWDLVRVWYFSENKKIPENEGVAKKILSAEPKFQVTNEIDPDIRSRILQEKKIYKFYDNPTSNFGPKAAANTKSKNSKK